MRCAERWASARRCLAAIPDRIGYHDAVGVLIGVIAGLAVAKAITLIIGFPSEIELWSIALGLFAATAVGIFFGV
jgi:hypothetical protein